jgi:ketosteroid isomerase-like protein
VTDDRSRSTPVAVVQAMYEAINARDYDEGFALVTEDFEWHEPAQAFHGGMHSGSEEIRQRLESQLEVFDEFAIEPEEFHEQGDLVAVPVRQRARGGRAGSKSRSASVTCGRSATAGSRAWTCSERRPFPPRLGRSASPAPARGTQFGPVAAPYAGTNAETLP